MGIRGGGQEAFKGGQQRGGIGVFDNGQLWGGGRREDGETPPKRVTVEDGQGKED